METKLSDGKAHVRAECRRVIVPSQAEFTDAAIEISRILRDAKIEAPLRPRIIAALILALRAGEIDRGASALSSVNGLIEEAINGASALAPEYKAKLINAFRLSAGDFARLSPCLGRIEGVLHKLNVNSVLQTDADFFGLFYEAFLRYGYDNNALGIVFTPRHIARFCVDLVGVGVSDKVIDIACGTGGFLVSAYEAMVHDAELPGTTPMQSLKHSIYGSDTNPTVWSLAALNLLFRGDGSDHIELASCFEENRRRTLAGRFSRAFLNPPFSQDAEPERDFIDVAMEALKPGGLLAVVAYAGIFADEDHAEWRAAFTRKHSVLGMVSLPEDLFYPTAAPTTILVAKAHIPQADDDSVFMSRIWNDGFEKLKNRRVERPGSELPEATAGFRSMLAGQEFHSRLAVAVRGALIKSGNEWSPQQWLPEPDLTAPEIHTLKRGVLTSIYRAVADMPELADVALQNFSAAWNSLPKLPGNEWAPLEEFFNVHNGKSREKSISWTGAALMSPAGMPVTASFVWWNQSRRNLCGRRHHGHCFWPSLPAAMAFYGTGKWRQLRSYTHSEVSNVGGRPAVVRRPDQCAKMAVFLCQNGHQVAPRAPGVASPPQREIRPISIAENIRELRDKLVQLSTVFEW